MTCDNGCKEDLLTKRMVQTTKKLACILHRCILLFLIFSVAFECRQIYIISLLAKIRFGENQRDCGLEWWENTMFTPIVCTNVCLPFPVLNLVIFANKIIAQVSTEFVHKSHAEKSAGNSLRYKSQCKFALCYYLHKFNVDLHFATDYTNFSLLC